MHYEKIRTLLIIYRLIGITTIVAVLLVEGSFLKGAFVAFTFFNSIYGYYVSKKFWEMDLKHSKSNLIKTVFMGQSIATIYMYRERSKWYLSRKLLINSLLLYYVFNWWQSLPLNYIVIYLIVVLILLGYFEEHHFINRIKLGKFGMNKYEAKQLIDFIKEQSDKIDFTDDSGKPRKLFDLESDLDPEIKKLPGISSLLTSYVR